MERGSSQRRCRWPHRTIPINANTRRFTMPTLQTARKSSAPAFAERFKLPLVIFSAGVIWGGGTAIAMPNPNTPSSLQFPTAGVVCDGATQVCYNKNGLSVGLTRTYYGAFAASNVERSLDGRPPGPQFRLSNGVICDAISAACWTNGWGQRVINRQLTAQLYGGNSDGWNPNNQGWAPNPGPSPWPAPTPANITGLCRLSRSYQVLFNGSCDLRELQQGFSKRFDVVLANGARYSFDNSDGNFAIADGSGGRWPVSFSDQGNGAVFRWQDYTLSTRQQSINGKTSTGRTIGKVLEALFN